MIEQDYAFIGIHFKKDSNVSGSAVEDRQDVGRDEGSEKYSIK